MCVRGVMKFAICVFDVLLYSKKVHTHASRKAGAIKQTEKKYMTR